MRRRNYAHHPSRHTGSGLWGAAGGPRNLRLAKRDGAELREDAIQTLTAENERLEAKLARTAAGIATMLPKNMSLDNPRWPDSTTVPLDTTLGELRALRALRSLLTELSEPKS
jgi:hypothetical protein